MPDSTLATLSRIRIKGRRLTRCPSVNMLSTAELDNAINSFILYDFYPSIVIKSLEKTLSFYTTANIDTYETSAVATDPLYNFKNEHLNLSAPIYVAGSRAQLYESTAQFYETYPKVMVKTELATGNGVDTNFTGTIDRIPLLRDNISITTTDINGDRLLATDDSGTFTGDVTVPGSISYLTGVYDITFDVAPANGETIWLQSVQYTAGKPNTILYLSNKLVVRPVPDMAYRIDIMSYHRPTELLADNDIPEMARWWQYIAYGAAIKILQDRLDTETIEKITPEFLNQERLVRRKSLLQNSGRCAQTIFNRS